MNTKDDYLNFLIESRVHPTTDEVKKVDPKYLQYIKECNEYLEDGESISFADWAMLNEMIENISETDADVLLESILNEQEKEFKNVAGKTIFTQSLKKKILKGFFIGGLAVVLRILAALTAGSAIPATYGASILALIPVSMVITKFKRMAEDKCSRLCKYTGPIQMKKIKNRLCAIRCHIQAIDDTIERIDEDLSVLETKVTDVKIKDKLKTKYMKRRDILVKQRREFSMLLKHTQHQDS